MLWVVDLGCVLGCGFRASSGIGLGGGFLRDGFKLYLRVNCALGHGFRLWVYGVGLGCEFMMRMKEIM